MEKVLFWFRNDLRLHDNEALFKAASLGPVLPVYVLDDRQLSDTFLGFRKMGMFRAKFLLESLANLQENLQAIGSNLLVIKGLPEEVLPQLAKQYGVTRLVASKEAAQHETTIESELSQNLKSLNVDIELHWGSATLYHPRDLPFQIHYLPNIFTQFRLKIEEKSPVRPLIPSVTEIQLIDFEGNTAIPTLEELGYSPAPPDPRAVMDFKGGESEGLKRLQEFIWETKAILTYKETRNGLLGANFSSKFSAWLSLGCLSPRFIYHEVKRFEAAHEANESTYWLIFELLWRDYFHFVSLKYGVRLFKTGGIRHDMARVWNKDHEAFERWKTGQTGVPFVDANMRELNATGYMSNRGRQNVASYLINDLGVEWTWGAFYFEKQLIDFDVCVNWGNWNYIAGVGNDPRPDRYFNISKQAAQYDPEGAYVKAWLGE